MFDIWQPLRVVIVTLFVTSPAAAQFVPAPNPPLPFPFPVGNGPVSIVSGNFNSNSYGLPDLAVLNQVDGTVTFILSTAPGIYSGASGPFPVGSNPGSLLPSFMAVGDFDNDGNQDLAIANAGNDSVTVMLGDGNGGIKATLPPVSVGKTPDCIAVGDFDGDGNQDLVVTNRDSNNVTVLQGDGSGNFSPFPGSPIPVGSSNSSPSSVAVGDFNGDGILDLAVTNELDNTVTVLLGNGAGSFQPTATSPFPVGYNPSFVAVSDFNLDGYLDLAVANLSSNTVAVFLGNGTGAFLADPAGPFTVGTAPVFVQVSDFNGDYIPDLAIANSGSNNVTVLFGDGTGKFNPDSGSPYVAGSVPRSLAVGDFNGQGPMDLAIADYGSDSVDLLINTFTSVPVMLSAASLSPTGSVAPGSVVSIFGNGMTSATTGTAPSQSATTVSVKDFSGAKYPVTSTYLSPTQINALLPPEAAAGAATFTIATATGGLQTGSVTLAQVAPGLFSANQSGKGVAAGLFFTDLLADMPTPVSNCPAIISTTSPCTALPLDVSGGDAVLVLFGTGIRNRASLSAVTVTINGQSFPAFFAGAVPNDPGVDEVQVALPPSLVHSGIVYVTVTVSGVTSNQVTVWLM